MQKENKRKKEYLDNYIPDQPYKMKEFQNVAPKVSTINTIKIEKSKSNKNQPMLKSKSLNKFKSNVDSKRSDSLGTNNRVYKSYGLNNETNSNKIYNPKKEENIYNVSSQKADEDFKIMGRDAYVLSHNIYNNPIGNLNVKLHDITDQLPNENSKKPKIKGETPKAYEVNQLLPKPKKNHIAENKIKAIEATRKPEARKSEKIEHKNYGKVPD